MLGANPHRLLAQCLWFLIGLVYWGLKSSPTWCSIAPHEQLTLRINYVKKWTFQAHQGLYWGADPLLFGRVFLEDLANRCFPVGAVNPSDTMQPRLKRHSVIDQPKKELPQPFGFNGSICQPEFREGYDPFSMGKTEGGRWGFGRGADKPLDRTGLIDWWQFYDLIFSLKLYHKHPEQCHYTTANVLFSYIYK